VGESAVLNGKEGCYDARLLAAKMLH